MRLASRADHASMSANAVSELAQVLFEHEKALEEFGKYGSSHQRSSSDILSTSSSEASLSGSATVSPPVG